MLTLSHIQQFCNKCLSKHLPVFKNEDTLYNWKNNHNIIEWKWKQFYFCHNVFKTYLLQRCLKVFVYDTVQIIWSHLVWKNQKISFHLSFLEVFLKFKSHQWWNMLSVRQITPKSCLPRYSWKNESTRRRNLSWYISTVV